MLDNPPKRNKQKLEGNNLNLININYQHFYFPDPKQMQGGLFSFYIFNDHFNKYTLPLQLLQDDC